MLTVVSQSPSGRVVLARTDAFTLLPANDQVLLVGQVVTSLDEVGLTSVIITDQAGLPIPLVLPGRSGARGPGDGGGLRRAGGRRRARDRTGRASQRCVIRISAGRSGRIVTRGSARTGAPEGASRTARQIMARDRTASA